MTGEELCLILHEFFMPVVDICPGGGTYWRLLLCITSLQLSWFPQTMLKALVGSITSLPSLSLCLIMCPPVSPQCLFSFPTQTSTTVGSQFLSAWSCLLWPVCFSGRFPPAAPSCHASAGGNFSCQWHLSQQGLLTAADDC